jgi:iron-sulfur cluster repair protein YtfE (RIC family)
VHAAIRSALDAFAAAAAALLTCEVPRPDALAILAERLRFLRAVCTYHSASEDDVVFPAVRRVARVQFLAGALLFNEYSDGTDICQTRVTVTRQISPGHLSCPWTRLSGARVIYPVSAARLGSALACRTNGCRAEAGFISL